MDRQTQEARKMAKELPFWAKVDHIWTYYKWWFIGAAAIILLVGGTIHERLTRPVYDMEIAFYSEDYVSQEKLAALEEYIAPFITDLDGDGEKRVKVYSVSAAMVDEGGNGLATIQSKLAIELISGSYPVFFFDDVFYEILQMEAYRQTMESYREMSSFPDLQEILQVPEGEHVYWATRSLYEQEEGEMESIALHDMAAETETLIFGPRDEKK